MTNMFPPPASFSMPPGCPPPGCFDPNALLQCYGDLQALTTLITQIVQNLAATDPAFQKALVDAIVASGSNIPLIGVTNGAVAQPGQVGEYIEFAQVVNYPVTQSFSQTVTMGVLQPGDWDCWCYAYSPQVSLTALNIAISPSPVTTNGVLQAFSGSVTGTDEFLVLVSPTAQVTCSTPQLIPMIVLTNQVGAGSAPGSVSVYFAARRRR